MGDVDDLISALRRKRELEMVLRSAKTELKTMSYKSIGEKFGRTADSTRYFARKLKLTSSDIL